MPDAAARWLAEALAAVPALAIALLGWYWARRDDKETIKALREENARLLDALERALERQS